MTRALVLLTCLLSLAGASSAQSLFSAYLDGTQEVPPAASDGCGWALVTLNPDDSLTYELHVTGLTGAGATAAHIHTGAAGVSGGVLVPLSGGPDVYSGTSAPLSAGSISSLRSEGLYVNVHSAMFSGGEIRGQLLNATTSYGARLRARQVEPAVDSLAHGTLALTLNANLTLDYSLQVFNVADTTPDAALRFGVEGSNGAELAALTRTSASTWAGTTAALGVDELATLQAGGIYVVVTSDSHPLGQTRGQLLPSSLSLLPGCSDLDLSVSGAPSTYGRLDVAVSGGAPDTMGVLIGSLDAGLTQLNGQPIVLDVPTIVSAITVIPLDGLGAGQLQAPIADITSDFTLTWQFFDLTSAAPNGYFVASNGVRVPIQHLEEDTPISFASDVYPFFSSAPYSCNTCHVTGGPFTVPWVVQPTAGATWTQLQNSIAKSDPATSLLLSYPVTPMSGHTGGMLFANTSDTMYQALLTWIASGAPNN